MKKIVIVGILLSFICDSYGQNIKDSAETYLVGGFIQIKIRSGYTIYGTESISLQREGLIYWTDPFLADLPQEKKNEEAKFIPFTELDKDKVFKIMKYVYEQKLYEIKKLEIPEGCIRPEGMPTVLTFLVLNTNTYSSFSYWVCDERVDKLIKMMNELIPKEDREKFGIRLRCD